MAEGVLWAFANQRLGNNVALLKPVIPRLRTFNIFAIKTLDFWNLCADA
jgi:hypothetical protein